jgi:glutamate--cysteine ligase
MPCVVGGESQVPIAEYGRSNQGMMKHIYRVGLGFRYGRVMQVIAGVHFNYSVPENLWELLHQEEGGIQERRTFADAAYMGMVRNIQRYGWLVPYLFGASPAVCKTFFGGRATDMPVFDEGTHYEPYATSLRMGDIGYQNQKEESVGIKACYDSVEAYVASLAHAIETPAPLWEAIGVKVDNEWRQLNGNILQIENEYYSTVRPKPLARGLEKPTLALKRRGIAYVELRSLDINAYDPMGIGQSDARFLESFMLFCLLTDSPRISPDEAREVDYNLQRTAHQGRKPGLTLARNARRVELRVWARDVLDAMIPLCEMMDSGCGGRPYSTALEEQSAKVEDSALTASARMLADMRANGESFHSFARRMSVQHRDYFSRHRKRDAFVRELDEEAARSQALQHELEAGADQSFDDFLAGYFAQK